jgi:hypothetical protein
LACAGFAALWGQVSPSAVLGLALFATCYFGLLARARHPVSLRCGVAAMFGLVHGFGFAGALRELSLTAEELAFPLLGFNVGVELGQIAVVLLLWPLLGVARRLSSEGVTRWATELSAASLCGLGLFWLVERSF